MHKLNKRGNGSPEKGIPAEDPFSIKFSCDSRFSSGGSFPIFKCKERDKIKISTCENKIDKLVSILKIV